jgi:hypothetical protein
LETESLNAGGEEEMNILTENILDGNYKNSEKSYRDNITRL